MTLEQTLIFLVYTGALLARKYPKHLEQTTDPKWINSLVSTRDWLHANDIHL